MIGRFGNKGSITLLDTVEAPMVDGVVDRAELMVYDDGQEQSGGIYAFRKGV